MTSRCIATALLLLTIAPQPYAQTVPLTASEIAQRYAPPTPRGPVPPNPYYMSPVPGGGQLWGVDRNLYGYGGANPVMHVDPSGESWVLYVGTIIGAVAIGAGFIGNTAQISYFKDLKPPPPPDLYKPFQIVRPNYCTNDNPTGAPYFTGGNYVIGAPRWPQQTIIPPGGDVEWTQINVDFPPSYSIQPIGRPVTGR